jgi:hypothetical protein
MNPNRLAGNPVLNRLAGARVLVCLLLLAVGAIGGVVVTHIAAQGEVRPRLVWGTVELVSGDGRQLIFRPDAEAGGREYLAAKEYWLDGQAIHTGSDSPTCLSAAQRAQIAAVRVRGKEQGLPDFDVVVWVRCPS